MGCSHPITLAQLERVLMSLQRVAFRLELDGLGLAVAQVRLELVRFRVAQLRQEAAA